MANQKAILGFIAGASLGAIAGILMAPETGAGTRKKIANRAGKLSDAVRSSVFNRKEEPTTTPGEAADNAGLKFPVVNPAKAGEDKIREVMHHAKASQS